MNKALLDTDTLSEVAKGADPIVARNFGAYRQVWGRLTTSTISQMEVIRGFQRTQSTRRLIQFMTSLAGEEVLPFDGAAAEVAGQIAGDLERLGRTIGVADPMIAAIAITNRLDLVTGNVRHFRQIGSLGYPLILFNWRI